MQMKGQRSDLHVSAKLWLYRRSNRSNVIRLGHTCDDSSDAETERANCSEAWRESTLVVPDSDIISSHTLLEQEMIAERNTFVDSKPVADKVHEVVQETLQSYQYCSRFSLSCLSYLEITMTCDGDSDVYACCKSRPYESRYLRCIAGYHLHGQCYGVDL